MLYFTKETLDEMPFLIKVFIFLGLRRFLLGGTTQRNFQTIPSESKIHLPAALPKVDDFKATYR